MARGERGHVAVMLTLSLFMLFGMLGLAVDLGWSQFRRQAAQAAVEAAAIAAAKTAIGTGSSITCSATVICNSTAVNCPATTSSNLAAGCQYASTNGFSNSGNQTVTIAGNTTNLTGLGISSQLYWATATITERNPQLFSAVLGNRYGSIAVQATAGVFTSTAPTCLYVMDKTADRALAIGGNNSSIQSSCGVYVNSDAGNVGSPHPGGYALQSDGGAQINAAAINVVGAYKCNGNQPCFSPNPQQVNQTISDPLGGLPAPAYSGCDHTGQTNISQGTVTLTAGVYCGGITISGNANVTFGSGTYILNGGGLQINSANTVVNGSGVTFFNTSNGYSYGPIDIEGQPSVNFSAPTTGTYEGVLFYQDRNITSTQQNKIVGNSNPHMVGDLYFPTTPLLISGGSASSPFTGRVIADTFQVNGGGSGVFISLSGPATCCANGTVTQLIQ